MNEQKDSIQKNRLDVYSTLLVSLAAFTITWCSCQDALWGDIQKIRMAESNRYYRNAQQIALMDAQRREIDVAIALNFLNAVIENKKDRVNYYLARNKPGLSAIMSDWLSMDPLHNEQAPPHPLAMEEYKQQIKASQAVSDSVTNKADDLWKEAQHANNISDGYTVLSVIFSLVMFLGAISPKTGRIKTGYVFVVLAGIIFIGVLVILIFLMPVTTATR